MTWSNIAKIETSADEVEIQTPDGRQILVGDGESESLLYREEFDYWNSVNKGSGDSWNNTVKTIPVGWVHGDKVVEDSWSTLSKIEQTLDEVQIHTPDGRQILVGENDDILLYREELENWAILSKDLLGNWSALNKNLSENWDQEAKISSTLESVELQTPDGRQILAGDGEISVVLYKEAYDLWLRESKSGAGSWENKVKVTQSGGVLYILTPDSYYILLGSDEDETLIFRNKFDNWNPEDKILEEDWEELIK